VEEICGILLWVENDDGKGAVLLFFLGMLPCGVGFGALVFVGVSSAQQVYYHQFAPHPYTILLSLHAHDSRTQHMQIL
jgi:hypothetical protein